MKFAFLLCFISFLSYSYGPPKDLEDIKFEQKIGSLLNTKITVRNEKNEIRPLSTYLNNKPSIFAFTYGDCQTLCSLVINGLIKGLNDIDLIAGKDFQVLLLSIDPHETTSTLSARKAMVQKRYLKPTKSEGWHFLSSTKDQIDLAASELGFNYKYDPKSKQYAHASGIIFLRPDAFVSSYLFGVNYNPAAIEKDLRVASKNRSGDIVTQILLYCFHYDPDKDKYGALIIQSLRIAGGFTILLVSAGIAYLSFKRKEQA